MRFKKNTKGYSSWTGKRQHPVLNSHAKNLYIQHLIKHFFPFGLQVHACTLNQQLHNKQQKLRCRSTAESWTWASPCP